MDKGLNIIIVGVGGQGTLLTSRILGSVGTNLNYDVKVSEVHGMSQRGGSVVTYVRLGKSVFSPLIEKGEADVIIAFELLEAYRWLDYLKEGGKLIINNQRIDPMPVIMGIKEYPGEILEKLDALNIDAIPVDALDMARNCGNIKAVNTVLIGVLAKSTGIEKDVWIDSLKENIKEAFIDLNLKAFESGYNL